jgi:hypothetical protein
MKDVNPFGRLGRDLPAWLSGALVLGTMAAALYFERQQPPVNLVGMISSCSSVITSE